MSTNRDLKTRLEGIAQAAASLGRAVENFRRDLDRRPPSPEGQLRTWVVEYTTDHQILVSARTWSEAHRKARTFTGGDRITRIDLKAT